MPNVAYKGEVFSEGTDGTLTPTDINGNLNPGGNPMWYAGQTGRPFKERCRGTSTALTPLGGSTNTTYTRTDVQIAKCIEEKRNKSELASYVWELKDQVMNPVVKWTILKEAYNYKMGLLFVI